MTAVRDKRLALSSGAIVRKVTTVTSCSSAPTECQKTLAWLERGGNWFAGQYRIYRSAYGCTLWLYGKRICRVGDKFSTVASAKAKAESHRAKNQWNKG